ncbi:MAG: leucyl/phenylalanyl-tRNA--protein transferase [Candidatus Nanopelagicales bacterium]|nr:leucyl/phenylalanyl-tRNA--protein transferase [Candidatus Nanopelagicales bacterium]
MRPPARPPVEPPATPWRLPDVRGAPTGVELVAVGAALDPGTLLAGYRRGLFPMPEGALLGWWSPDPRGILRPDQLHVSRSLRRALRRFTVSLDTAFEAVVAGCADPGRPHGWITGDYAAAYAGLHGLGWAHSLEVWDAGGRLVGGLFGVEVGGLFAAESKFHRATDASKVAVVALADLLAADGRPERLIDVQWRTPHLGSLGALAVPRRAYLRLLAEALPLPPVLGWGVPDDAAPVASDPAGAVPSRIRWRTG